MTGRPVIEIDENELKELMQFYPTLEETAAWFKCSPDTIERRVKTVYGASFAEFRKFFSGKTRLMLKRKAISKALDENNDKMLTYCLRTMTDLDDREKNDFRLNADMVSLEFIQRNFDEDERNL